MTVVDALRVDVAVLLDVVLVGWSLLRLRRRIFSGRSCRRLSVFKVRVVVALRGHVVLILVVRLRVRLVGGKQFLDRHGKRWAHVEYTCQWRIRGKGYYARDVKLAGLRATHLIFANVTSRRISKSISPHQKDTFTP